MVPRVREGKVKTREDIVRGLEDAPEAFLGMLRGKNFGKLSVQRAESGAAVGRCGQG